MDKTLQLTEQLNKHLAVLAQKFEEKAVILGDKEAFERIKIETVPIYEILESWEESTLALIKNRDLTLHPQQVVATKENYEMLLMHSYFRDIRKRKYIETKNSCYYILKQIIGELKDEGTIN